ncbi:MAG: magnesium transporter [Clostridiales bacterium]|nr:magnesium transporter [Clostridiales bacterium]
MDWDTVTSRLNQMLAEGKTAQLRGALRMLNRVDVAQYLSGLDTDKMLLVFRLLPSSIASDVFSYMDDEQREKLIFSIGDREISRLIDDMFIDDAVDFLEDMPQDLVTRVLANVSPDTRETINRFLQYPENSAGSIMTVEYCAFPGRLTVDEAMGEIKRTGLDKETVNTLYVVDEDGMLTGTVPLRKLICASGDAPLSSIMETTFVSVHTLDDRELVAAEVQKYDLLAVPVTDREGRMVGIITLDDIMDVVQEETTEDIEMMSALTPSEDTYLNTGIWDLVKNRLPWLAIMLVASIFTGLIISHYEDILSGAAVFGVALTACIPMLMDTGGNCGQQSSTLIIRSLATGEIAPADALKVLWKELRVALLVSVALAAVCFGIQYLLFERPLDVTLVISGSMILAVVFSKVLGGLLPLGARALGLDPALTASPLITTMADTCSLLILFAIASAVLI